MKVPCWAVGSCSDDDEEEAEKEESKGLGCLGAPAGRPSSPSHAAGVLCCDWCGVGV